ncbi:MAG: extracellular solute-binding protein [Propionibacteriaceae bacterium]|nr:extracellular solute-binding protein [Propionibacteriaceae bacterium]
MNLSRRTIFGAGTGLAAAATLTACGENKGPLSPGSSGSKPAITQWYHEYGEQGVQEAVKKYAADYPEAAVTVKWNPGDYGKLLSAALLTEDVPDVFEGEMGASLDMISAGQVVDLTDIMRPAMAAFNPAVMKRFTFKDKVYAIPQTIDMQLLYYRPSVLSKAGVEPPKTFDEFVRAAKAVRTADMGGFFAGNDGGVGVLANMLVWASGNDQLNPERTAAGFATQSFYDAVVAYRAFFQSGDLLQSASGDWYNSSPFANGETAMQWGGLWSLPEIKQALGEDVGVLPFPAVGASGRPAVPFGAFGACVAAKSKNVEAAKAFVKWLWIDSEDRQVDFSNSYGTHIPAKTALVSRADKLASGPGADAARFVAEHGFASDIMWTGPLGDAFSAAFSNCIKQNADPATEFAPVAEKAISELKRVGG